MTQQSNKHKALSFVIRFMMLASAMLMVFSLPAPVVQAATSTGERSKPPADPKPYDEGNSALDVKAPAGLVFYFDSVAGKDTNTGTSADQAWQTLAKFNSVVFPAGSTIYLKRGSVWTGAAIIKSNGSLGSRIRYTAYGSGALPTFRNPGETGYFKVAIRITGDYNTLEYVKVQEALLAGVYIDTGADYNNVRYIEATQVGEGVNIHGAYAKVTRNNIHDLVMVVNTVGGDDDYGAVGIWVFSSNNEIAYNRIVNCRAPSYDYGEDGGAVEFYKNTNNNKVHHNYANNTKGFSEIGGGTNYDNIISYNVMVNTGRALGLHMGGTFGSDIRRLRFENNTVVDTTAAGFWATILFLDGTPTQSTLIMRNNIFYLANFGKISNLANANFLHSNNLYYLPKGTLNFIPAASEIQADPRFASLAGGNFVLQTTSPAIDKGLMLGYTKDYANKAVHKGLAPEMGAYEQP